MGIFSRDKEVSPRPPPKYSSIEQYMDEHELIAQSNNDAPLSAVIPVWDTDLPDGVPVHYAFERVERRLLDRIKGLEVRVQGLENPERKQPPD